MLKCESGPVGGAGTTSTATPTARFLWSILQQCRLKQPQVLSNTGHLRHNEFLPLPLPVAELLEPGHLRVQQLIGHHNTTTTAGGSWATDNTASPVPTTSPGPFTDSAGINLSSRNYGEEAKFFFRLHSINQKLASTMNSSPTETTLSSS